MSYQTSLPDERAQYESIDTRWVPPPCPLGRSLRHTQGPSPQPYTAVCLAPRFAACRKVPHTAPHSITLTSLPPALRTLRFFQVDEVPSASDIAATPARRQRLAVRSVVIGGVVVLCGFVGKAALQGGTTTPAMNLDAGSRWQRHGRRRHCERRDGQRCGRARP